MQTSVGSQWNCTSFSKGWIWHHVLQALRDLLPVWLDLWHKIYGQAETAQK